MTVSSPSTSARRLPRHADRNGTGAGRVDVTERDLDGVRILTLSGELDLATAGAVCARVQAACRDGRRRLLFDLTGLEFCDSQGLRALIGAAREVAACAGRLAVVPPAHGTVARLFALTGTAEFLDLRATVPAGLAAVR